MFRFVTIHAFDGQTDRRIDGRTDRRTDSFLIARLRLHSMQRGDKIKNDNTMHLKTGPIVNLSYLYFDEG